MHQCWRIENLNKPGHRGPGEEGAKPGAGNPTSPGRRLTAHLQELAAGLAVAVHAVLKGLLQGGAFHLDQVKGASEG